jgi:hypothetical protein
MNNLFHNKKNMFLLVVIGLFTAGEANAQWTLSLPPPTQTAAFFANDNISREISEEIPRQRPRLEKALPEVSLSFKPSSVRRKKNTADFIMKMRELSPENGDALEFQSKQIDVFSALQSQLAPLGLNVNNAADAYTLYWITIWEVSNGFVRPMRAAEVRAVKEQVSKIMRTAPEFAALKTSEKQDFADSLNLTSLVIGASLEAVASDPKQLAHYAKQMKQRAIAEGFAVDRMTLTEDGFVPAKGRKRSDASDAAEGEEKALASATPADPSAEGSSNYALIAGAAGAGLGFGFLFAKAMGRKA